MCGWRNSRVCPRLPGAKDTPGPPCTKASLPFITCNTYTERLIWVNVIKKRNILKCRFSLHSPRVRDSSCSPEGVATRAQASGRRRPEAGGGSPGAGNLSMSCWAPRALSLVAPRPDSRAHHTRASLPERDLGQALLPRKPRRPASPHRGPRTRPAGPVSSSHHCIKHDPRGEGACYLSFLTNLVNHSSKRGPCL